MVKRSILKTSHGFVDESNVNYISGLTRLNFLTCEGL